MMK
jgi:hypothetical protein